LCRRQGRGNGGDGGFHNWGIQADGVEKQGKGWGKVTNGRKSRVKKMLSRTNPTGAGGPQVRKWELGHASAKKKKKKKILSFGGKVSRGPREKKRLKEGFKVTAPGKRRITRGQGKQWRGQKKNRYKEKGSGVTKKRSREAGGKKKPFQTMKEYRNRTHQVKSKKTVTRKKIGRKKRKKRGKKKLNEGKEANEGGKKLNPAKPTEGSFFKTQHRNTVTKPGKRKPERKDKVALSGGSQ